MGFLSFFKSSATVPNQLSIDLVTFQVAGTRLGVAPVEADFFAKSFQMSDVFRNSKEGIELGTKDGVLDYAFLTMDSFEGEFVLDGAPSEIGKDSSEATIRAKFGEPYWIDRSDGETIMFYEYEGGSIELQFEFPSASSLGYVTLSRDGVLSSEEDRKAYGVDKPWPPNENLSV